MSPEAAYRAQFTEDEGYLDFARVGPPSTAVVAASSAALTSAGAAAVGTVDALMTAGARAVAAASRLTGAEPHRVAYTADTSGALLQVAFALHGAGPSDPPRVLVSPAEFPANLYPWWRAQQAGRLVVDLLPSAPVTPERVRAALRPGTAALAVSAVDFATGHRADLGGLREVLGDRLLVVDAIQGLGAVDQDWTPADVLVAGGQKWLRSGWGTGVLVTSDRALERLVPLLAGWTAVREPGLYDGLEHPLADGPARFSVTNTSPVAQAGLAAGLELLETVGPRWVAGRIAERVGELLEVLDRRGAVVTSAREPARRAGIVAFTVPGVDGAHLHAALARAGVASTRHGQRVRLSVHASTTPTALARVDAGVRTATAHVQ